MESNELLIEEHKWPVRWLTRQEVEQLYPTPRCNEVVCVPLELVELDRFADEGNPNHD